MGETEEEKAQENESKEEEKKQEGCIPRDEKLRILLQLLQSLHCCQCYQCNLHVQREGNIRLSCSYLLDLANLVKFMQLARELSPKGYCAWLIVLLFILSMASVCDLLDLNL